MLYVTKQQAIECGMTHHGRIYGVPAWVRETPDGVDAATKITFMGYWCDFMDWLYDQATYFMAADQCIESPLRVLRPIQE